LIVLRWAFVAALRRLMLVALIVFAVGAYRANYREVGAAMRDWLDHASPFAPVNRVLP
jgi:hypothetical protein